MKSKVFGAFAAAMVMVGGWALPAAAQSHYAAYDYSNYYYNYANPYVDYNYASYGHPGYYNRNWNYNYGYSNYAPGYAAYNCNCGHGHTNYVKSAKGGIVLTQPLDFRMVPSVSAPMYGFLEAGTRMTLLGRGHGWAKVRSKWGTVGYIPDNDYWH